MHTVLLKAEVSLAGPTAIFVHNFTACSMDPSARFLAAAVPILNVAR